MTCSDSEFDKAFARDINILQDLTSNRLAKKKALERISSQLNQNTSFSRQFFHTSLVKSICLALGDPVEKCREMSADILKNSLQFCDDISDSLPWIMQELDSRLMEKTEPAEEIRLALIEIASKVAVIAQDKSASQLDKFVSILRSVTLDPFAQVKKESCQLLINLCQSCPKALQYYGKDLSLLLVPCLTHRHSAVRIKALEALESCILVDLSGLDDILKYLAVISRDNSVQVREKLYSLIRNWSLSLPDRYSVSHKILPFLLSGLSESTTDVLEHVKNAFNDIGQLYETEWYDKVKKDLDLLPLNGPVPEIRVGTIHLLRENGMKIVEFCVGLLNSWSVEERVQGAQILNALAWHIKDYITGYSGNIIPVLAKICASDEPQVIEVALELSKILGNNVAPTVYIGCVINDLRILEGSNLKIGILMVLNGLFQGTDPLVLTEDFRGIVEIMSFLKPSSTEISKLSGQMHMCVETLVEKFHGLEYNAFIAKTLFDSLIVFKSIGLNSDAAISHLVAYSKQQSPSLLLSDYFDGYLDNFLNSCQSWTKFSIDILIFKVFCLEIGELLNSSQRLENILRIFVECTESTDLHLKQDLLNLLSALTGNLKKWKCYANWVNSLIGQVLLPSLLWKPGKQAIIIRSKAIESLENCIEYLIDFNLDIRDMDEIVKALLGLIDEDLMSTRKTCIVLLSKLLATRSFNGNVLRTIYPEILKRMDDAHNELRVLTCDAFVNLLKCIASIQNIPDEMFSDEMLKYLIDGMLLHMDDTSPIIQNAVYDALRAVKILIPSHILMDAVEKAKGIHRNNFFLDKM